MDSRQHLSSLRRGLRVLALLNQKTTVTIAEVAQSLELPRTTAQRVVNTLVLEGYVERVPRSRLYRLTPAVNMLSGGFSDESWVSHIASPLLFNKTGEIGWPMSLATPFGEDMMVRVSTDQSTSLALDHFQIGFKTPIMYSTSGHVILAFASPAYRAALLDLLQRSENPLQADAHDPRMVKYIIDKVRTRGFEHMAYVDFPEASISVPVFLNGSVVATLLLTYIKRAISREAAETQFVPMLRDLASRIEEEVLTSKQRVGQSLSAAPWLAPNRGFAPVGNSDEARALT